MGETVGNPVEVEEVQVLYAAVVVALGSPVVVPPDPTLTAMGGEIK